MELPGVLLFIVLGVIRISKSLGAVHDELPQCGLHGVYRQRQSLVDSPNYPDNYPVNTCWDYVIRSPYRCPTKFHIQFLDFKLELSENCSRDYLAIGLNNDGDDMDVLCGQVLGIKKYHTPDGVLRLRFLSDDSPWTTNGGFRLLITRLACEREDLVARGLDGDEDEVAVDGDTVQVSAKSPPKKLHHHHHQQQQQQTPQQQQQQEPTFNFTQPNRLGFNFGLPPALGYPAGFYPPPAGLAPQHSPPCAPQQQQQQLLQQQQEQQRFLQQQFLQQQHLMQQQQLQLPQQQQQILQQQQLQQQILQQQQLQQQQLQLPQQQQQELPLISDQYQTTSFQPHAVTLKDYDSQTLQQFGGQLDLCCASSFNQNHFYLSSPGFPRTVLNYLLPNQQRDCVFYIEKSSPNVCRLRIQFKFFDFGQNSGGFGGGVSGGGFNGGGFNQGGGFGGQHNCNGDFLEVDGQRYCGCRSGYIHKSHWDQGRKALRMRIGQSSSTTSNGFLLEIFQDQDSDGCRQDVGSGFGLGLQQQQQPQRGLGVGLGVGLWPQVGFQPQLGLPHPQQQQLWPMQTGYPGFVSNYPLPFAATPYRTARRISYARGIDAQQPSRVVETNSTRKEFYYFDGDEAFARTALEDEAEDKASLGVSTQPQSHLPLQSQLKTESPVVTKAFEQSSCSFDYMEVLKLSVDTLWLTKPLCFSPLRSWFPNIFG
ncbi:uncharacterized protein [Drosophila takahashii]|uniref:uncharacterized protein n=1 Tax=Drosophila takahashii TaxID=29030 RepID=UPI001CF92B91|nr:uncharacterized protein LOC108063654 [Drosophila takahashii]